LEIDFIPHSREFSLKNSDVAEPKPKPDEALSGVEAFSLNHGELPKLGFFPQGTTGGWTAPVA
jgi:hypothetical protein